MKGDIETVIERLNRLEEENAGIRVLVASAEGRYLRAERRFRVLAGLALVGLIGAIFVSSTRPASAGRWDLDSRVTALEARMTAVEAQLAVKSPLLKAISDLRAKTQFMHVDGTDTIFTGTNVHIVNGTNVTSSSNSLGNLIIGYNALRGIAAEDFRTGSHCLILGDFNSYNSYGGIIAGEHNQLNGTYSSVLGGFDNTTSGNRSIILGGGFSSTTGEDSTVSGGDGNVASGTQSSVAGGSGNEASGLGAFCSGGQFNLANGQFGSVTGGFKNKASGPSMCTVSGGVQITNTDNFGWQGGSFHTP